MKRRPSNNGPAWRPTAIQGHPWPFISRGKCRYQHLAKNRNTSLLFALPALFAVHRQSNMSRPVQKIEGVDYCERLAWLWLSIGGGQFKFAFKWNA